MTGLPRTRERRGGDVVAAPVALPPRRAVELADGSSVDVRVAPGVNPVLLLHGWALTADVNFCHLMQPVADSYGLVAMDMRGHGRGLPLAAGERFDIAQCADDAAAVLDALGIDQVVVCGYSLGGPVGLEFARRHRDRVRGLVFEATAMAFDSTEDKVGRVFFRGLRPFAHRSGGIGRSVPLSYFWKARLKSEEVARLWPWLRAELGHCHPRVIVDVILAEYVFDFRPYAAEVAGLPAAVVVTTRDGAVPPRDQRTLAALLNATVIELVAAHDVFLTDPAKYIAATRSALEAVLNH
ncbi:alpha/beta hydrolase [Nocardia colli]|uniref:Alpha/beta hydrolase n=1 Tax=Nocardia colli TaxID=2545717 RepID=A0A5N0E0Q6_9NOCA|nr:alpha/beta fold hydrolase [Nocardia colli]KAA8882992.1 alpha/beta hydrolase [Nocardia colli]